MIQSRLVGDKMLRLLCVLSIVLIVLGAPKNGKNRANVQVATEEAISNGYVSEIHQAVTDDGYILTMQRLPYARSQTSGSADRPVVFVMHGLYGASTNFLFMGPEYSIGYNLADAGFDVWFGNARGNVNGRAHSSLNLDSEEEHAKFYDFSWEEIGIHDLPAMIDYVLTVTGKEKLHYVGHSQGGTVFLVLASMRPEYNDKLASVHLLAGVGYQNYFPNELLTPLAMLTDIIYSIIQDMGLVEVDSDAFDLILGILGEEQHSRSDFCFGDIKYKHYCDLIGMQYLLRDDDPMADAGLGGGSVKQIAHYGQNIRDKLFRRFHYGAANQELYGSNNPPLYDLGLITANVTMHYTLNDDLLDERDVLDMAADMPNTVARKVARESFDHNDFLAATDAKALVNDYVIEAIQYVHDRDASNQEDEIVEPEVEVETQAPVTDSAADLNSNVILRLTLAVCVIYTLF